MKCAPFDSGCSYSLTQRGPIRRSVYTLILGLGTRKVFWYPSLSPITTVLVSIECLDTPRPPRVLPGKKRTEGREWDGVETFVGEVQRPGVQGVDTTPLSCERTSKPSESLYPTPSRVSIPTPSFTVVKTGGGMKEG